MSSDARIGLWVALTVVLGWLLYLLAPVLTPFLFAALLAYLGDPVVDRLEEQNFSRTFAVMAVFSVITIALLLLLLFLIPLLERQISGLLRRLPIYLDWFQINVLPWLQDSLGINPAALLDFFSYLKEEIASSPAKVGGLAANVLSSVTRSSAIIIGWLINLLLIPVVTFYLLRDWDVLMARIGELLPRRIEPIVVTLAKECDEILGAFLYGQFMVMLSLGIIYSLGLTFIGLEFSLLIGMLAGLISFVPYLGTIVGVVTAGAAALLQFQDVIHVALVLGVFAIGQAIETAVLYPLFVGDRIGMHPVAVIFAVLAGGQLFGFFGVLLALPVAAVIMVLLRHTHDEYLKSWLYGVKSK